jgi:type VI protein secretion system component Hcp
MAIDAYVKFGESDDMGGPDGKSPLPEFEGDSSDAKHWYWCELRECGFDMTAPQQQDDQAGASQGNGDSSNAADDNKASFAPVTLKKRVDWASTSLFSLCCEASMATMPNHDPKDGTGMIDQVTVEVCRPAPTADGNSEKIPFVKVRYYSVQITKYALSISGPEPSETITFKFDSVDFTYLQTSPYTNQVIGGEHSIQPPLENYHKKPNESAGDLAPAEPAVGPPGGSGSPGPSSAGTSPGGPGSTNGSPAPPGSAPNGVGTLAFPGGIWQSTAPPDLEN